MTHLIYMMKYEEFMLKEGSISLKKFDAKIRYWM